MEERYLIGTTLTSTKAYFPSTSLRAGMGGLYEVTDGAVKKYYSIAGQTVALRDDSGLQYLLTDHLGSVVAVTNASGTLTSQQRYLPFGEVRTIPNSPITVTDFGFTGQRALNGTGLSGTGLMDYRARFYSQALGRFIQPDSMIPSAINPQEFNRYSYVNNAPINFNDPSGHSRQDVIRQHKRAYGSSWHQYSRGWNRYGDSALPSARDSSSIPTFVILFCGVGDNPNGANCARPGEPDDRLAPYRSWAEQNGYQVFTYDVDDCGTKSACLDRVKLLLDAPVNFIFVGHSAGADVAILAAEYLVSAGRQSELNGVVLLDPTLTATVKDRPEYAERGGLTPLLMEVLAKGGRVFVADGIGSRSDEVGQPPIET
ncbi:MAG: RHS repeat-associated core domain-containing protein [Chloroflexota bacterium]